MVGGGSRAVTGGQRGLVRMDVREDGALLHSAGVGVNLSMEHGEDVGIGAHY